MNKNMFAFLLLSGFSVISSLTTRDFTFGPTSMSWLNAQNYCRSNLLDLATLDSIEDVTFLTAFLPSSYRLWIGLKRVPQLSWGWSAGQNTLPVYSMLHGNDTLQNNLCGAMYYGYWESLSCSTPLNFVCQNDYSSSLQQDYVSTLIDNTQRVWVGLFADSWAWSDQGTSSFRYWMSGEMQSLSETSDCAVMDTSMGGRWTNQSCDTVLPFSCYQLT
ncbi:uncharacterized protein LOC143483319 [Brachyhypopomus gauderio]|uniref:uncharacterized protein LOC143483319 n=1 Tax=Brachyhypopomus gauderio TaxID=698409 RepID=UPI0040418050